MSDNQNKFQKYIANLFRARFPAIYISTYEEKRICDLLEEISDNEALIKTKRSVFTWSQTQGMISMSGKSAGDTKAPLKALEFIEDYKNPAIFILKDFHVFFGVGNRAPDTVVIRKIRDLVISLKESDQPKNIVFISPMLVLPDDLQKDVTVVDYDLPTVEEIRQLFDELTAANRDRIQITRNEKDAFALCKAAQGLTLQEAENAFARAMVEKGALTANELDVIMDEKYQVIKKTGILEFIKSDMNIDDVGGLENLKRWLIKRNRSWLDDAKKYHLPAPKGVLITGIAGCGKSLLAKAISSMWKLPLLRLDMGRIFSGIVGSSEENMRKAIKTAEAVAPSILWIDEIEKGFGSANSSSGDSGTSARIFGTFLTWMQEKTKPVFVVATANKIDSLPAELLRKGRFDEIFFVDLPTQRERVDIFRLHLSKRLKDNEIGIRFDYNDDTLLNDFAEKTEGFGGAEIEQIIVAALFEAFANERTLEIEDIYKAIRTAVPLSVTQAEQITQIRAWANVRAVSATAQEDRQDYRLSNSPSADKKPIATPEEEHNISKHRGGRAIDF